MKCLSVRQPHAHRIFHCGKDIENRTWATKHRGPLLIHAGTTFDNDAVLDRREEELWKSGAMPRDCLYGVVNVVDCVRESDSPWYFGPIGWRLENPVPLKWVIPFKGRLGLFDVPGEVVREALEG